MKPHRMLKKDFEDGLIPPYISMMEVWMKRPEYFHEYSLFEFGCHFARIVGSFYTPEGKRYETILNRL